MHELSIALSIVDVAEEEAARHGGRVRAVHLQLGPLSGVVKEALLSAFELAREGSELAESELVVQDVAVTAYCPACAAEKPIESFPELRCPACGAPTPQVVHGRELEVVGLEIVES
ncbi:MAG TPA: hydrogenase maturation nickel metallochaperone HypA [Gemmataceae bacterium]|nr:hydrogenase maturation nickel metallochaperone HypA [Gemmataceae bacterium]